MIQIPRQISVVGCSPAEVATAWLLRVVAWSEVKGNRGAIDYSAVRVDGGGCDPHDGMIAWCELAGERAIDREIGRRLRAEIDDDVLVRCWADERLSHGRGEGAEYLHLVAGLTRSQVRGALHRVDTAVCRLLAEYEQVTW